MRDPKDVNILIVDDEVALRNAIIFDFKRKGYNVLSAENGTQAFEIIKNSKIDVVLTDVRMPGGDGVQLLTNIRAHNSRLPVVMFITGFADITLEEAYDKGVDAVFSKPFERKALFAAVVKAITNEDEKWTSRKTERIETDFNIDLNFPDLNFATQGKVLNLGRGGIFVALKENFPSVDARAIFNINFQKGLVQKIVGTGIVRWIRTQPVENALTGCGIEFESFENQSREQVIALINSLKTSSFIPKG